MRFRAFLALLLAVVLPAGANELYHARSLYRDILVYEEDGLRCMKFGFYDGGRQSCIRPHDRDYLVFNYTKMMLGALYFNPTPKRILIIGLGGGTLPMALQALVPDAKIDCVEIDPTVVEVAKRFFYFVPAAGTRIVTEDGRVFVKHALQDGARYDLVMLDAFDREYIPEHMLTKEFLTEVTGLLTEDGVLAANTFSSSRLYDYETATYSKVFGAYYNLQLNNRVILLQRGRLPEYDQLFDNASPLADRFDRLGIDRDWLLRLFKIENGKVDESKVLTDQYSPSNLLNGPLDRR